MDFVKYLTKGIESHLLNLPIEPGKLRFVTDTMKIFLDLYDGTRIEFSDFIKNLTEDQILSTITPLPKLYLASDTHKIYIHDGENWVLCSGEVPEQVDKALFAENASSAVYATNASSAQYAEESKNATNASTAVYAQNSGTALYTPNSSTAVYSENTKKAVEADKAINADTAVYAETSNKAKEDILGNPIATTYAPLASPIFTGSPSAPTPITGSSDLQIANTQFVSEAIRNAISNITNFDTVTVNSFDELPETGVKGTIYFVPNQDSDENNISDEYIWVENKYEKIGSSKVSLTGYVHNVNVSGTGNAITEATIDDQGNMNFVKGASFLTDHPVVSYKDASTYYESPNHGDTIEVIDEIGRDSFGHLISYRKKSIKFPDSVANAGTANYTENAGTSQYATNASTAVYANNATSATNASTAQYAESAKNATSSVNSSSALYAENAASSTYSKNASSSAFATNADTASYSRNASSSMFANNAATASFANISKSTESVADEADLDFGELEDEVVEEV